MKEWRLSTDLFTRVIIVKTDNDHLAWSGMRWVPINGSVQICNFGTLEEAEAYAKEVIGDADPGTKERE